ncbi:MAG: N-6 DNA methylase [Kiritimatiellae bacterium]|nr:N-6 DNA methylase [Kiritimatiellia bacterium]
MLDSETKARIDSARDILVGKVPDPKSQVEQITIALIYKFMDDMDRQSEELGGKATFFTGDFKKYRWAQLLDKRFGGHERLLLYAEGIEKMNVNKNTPQLFRDIFKGVFLPYRDPETLNLFLKEINGFTYEHSERLGDAFEYLLSVLGTQGDAGQFRTPRHIIDFIVAVVDPKKNETVLDPACGTAGFLISAYKHILRSCSSKPSPQPSPTGRGGEDEGVASGDLTPDERARMMTNFRGYDIAPDMVRLSRVNLYLHGFPSPVIHEYDTLTSEQRWDERCDVILANPPFMSPKGGIRPHNRFSIQAKRSEVLFVDYIAEHLNPGGRAGIIVPEGIIFQSQNAYKALRKMLVENYLWAVVSLPAGVFNPYSGVKTSILFLDRNLAKRTNDVIFVKIANDGFDLGAQRRPNEGSQLAEAFKILNGHKKAQKAQEGELALTVSRKRILESPDVGLSGDRYRHAAVRHTGKWPMVRLQDICSLEYGYSLPERARRPGPFPVVGSNGITGWHEKASVPGPVIVVGRKGSAGEVNWIEQDCIPIDTTYYVRLKERKKTNLRFLYYLLAGMNMTSLRDGAGVPGLNRNEVYLKEIPLPPLAEQERIVAELEGYRKIIEGARQIFASYKPTIRIDPQWPVVTVADSCVLNPKKAEIDNLKGSTAVSFIPMSDIGEHAMYFEAKQRKRLDDVTTSYTYFKDGDVLIAKVTPCFENGKAGIARRLHNGIGFGSSEFYVIRPPKRYCPNGCSCA